jgi:hypothetical protein
VGATWISIPACPSTAQAIIWPSGDNETWRILCVFSNSSIKLPMRGSGGVVEAAALRVTINAIRTAPHAGASRRTGRINRGVGSCANISRDASTPPFSIHSQQSYRGRRFWTGAPCSPKRTWAKTILFQCFHSICDGFRAVEQRLAAGKNHGTLPKSTPALTPAAPSWYLKKVPH